MPSKTLIAALLFAAPAAASAAPASANLNPCSVVGFEDGSKGQDFMYAIAVHALNKNYPGLVATPAC